MQSLWQKNWKTLLNSIFQYPLSFNFVTLIWRIYSWKSNLIVLCRKKLILHYVRKFSLWILFSSENFQTLTCFRTFSVCEKLFAKSVPSKLLFFEKTILGLTLHLHFEELGLLIKSVENNINCVCYLSTVKNKLSGKNNPSKRTVRENWPWNFREKRTPCCSSLVNLSLVYKVIFRKVNLLGPHIVNKFLKLSTKNLPSVPLPFSYACSSWMFIKILIWEYD